MSPDVVSLRDVREQRIVQTWELAGTQPPQSVTIAARIAAHCLSCVKAKAKLVVKNAPWDVKHVESLNLVALMLDFASWRDLQAYAKEFHTLTQEQWRSDALSLRLVSACWVLKPQQEKLPVAQSILSRKLKLTVPGVPAKRLQELVRTAMCEAPEYQEPEPRPRGTSLAWTRTHYRARFVARIQEGLDPEPLRANALGMLKKMAPTLPSDVALDVVNFCLGGPETELLVSHETWLWPQADAGDHRLWGHEHARAADDVRSLGRRLEETRFPGWVCDAQMTDLRRWRDTYLPGQKLRRKWDIVMVLLETFRVAGHVPDALLREFADWQAAMREEVQHQMELAARPPVPRHLQYLAEMTFIRLDALFDYYDTSERTYRAAGVAAIITAASCKPVLPSAASIALELCPPEMRKYAYPSYEFCKWLTNVLATRIQAFVDQPAELKKYAAVWKLDTLHRGVCCEHCQRIPLTKAISEKYLPPFRPHCWCREIRWDSSALQRAEAEYWARPYESREHERPDFARHYATLMWWALHRWLQLPDTPEFPTVSAKLVEADLRRGRGEPTPANA